MAKSKQNYNLLVIAHPDDETLFFGGLLQQLRKAPWHVVCVTDANADGFGLNRYEQFHSCMKKLKVREHTFLNLPDFYEKRLDQNLLQHKLKEFSLPNMIYTHGPLGEYGHPHHQDVCYAVHSVFNKKTKIMAVAYNCEPQQKVILNSAQLKMKQFILANIYGSETKRFINLLPATHSEGFTEFSFAEVESIYNFFINGEIPNKKDLKYYKWFKWYFQNKKFQNLGRPF